MTDRDKALARRPVSRETIERLDRFAHLLAKWSQAINLIADSTAKTIWTRHILDSMSVFDACPVRTGVWVDIGAGAGFPGLVAAVVAAEEAAGLTFHLVESDQRKAVFLSEAARACGITPQIHAARIENLPPLGADIVSARAVAPLSRLLPMAFRHLSPTGLAILPKGSQADEELKSALERWRFTYEKRPSATDTDSVILLIRDIEHA